MKESGTRVTLQIGQQGLTESIVQELREQVKTRKVVKAKRLQTASAEGSEKEFWAGLAERAGVRLLEVRGHSAVFCDLRYRTEREQKREKSRTNA